MRKGFTLIEMVVVLGVTLLMLRQTLVFAGDFVVRYQLNFMTKEIRKYILQSRNYAVSSQLPSGSPGNLYYVKFAPVFSGLGSTGIIYSYLDDTGTTYPPKEINMSSFVITQNQELGFDVYSGKSVIGLGSTAVPRTNDVSFNISYTNPITKNVTSKVIYVRPSGLVEVQ